MIPRPRLLINVALVMVLGLAATGPVQAVSAPYQTGLVRWASEWGRGRVAARCGQRGLPASSTGHPAVAN